MYNYKNKNKHKYKNKYKRNHKSFTEASRLVIIFFSFQYISSFLIRIDILRVELVKTYPLNSQDEILLTEVIIGVVFLSWARKPENIDCVQKKFSIHSLLTHL